MSSRLPSCCSNWPMPPCCRSRSASLTRRQDAPGFLVSATIIVPQIITALLAARAGNLAQSIGRRPVLIVGFAAVPLRALLFATSPGAMPLAVFQALDGVSAAVFGLMLPLIAADLTKRTGLSQSRDWRPRPCRRSRRHLQHRRCRTGRRALRHQTDISRPCRRWRRRRRAAVGCDARNPPANEATDAHAGC